MSDVVLEVESVEGDPRDREEALYGLFRELSDTPIDVRQEMAPAPPGTKAVGTLSALLIVGMKTGAVASLIAVLRDYLKRNKDVKMKFQQGATLVELSGADPEKLTAALDRIAALFKGRDG